MKKITHYINFDDPQKESYTIPEIYEIARKNFGLPKGETIGKQQDKDYQNRVREIRRALKEVEPVEKGKRKTCYSKQTVRWLLDEKLYKYFLMQSNQYEAYFQEIKETKEFYQKASKSIRSQNDSDGYDSEMKEVLEEMIQKKKMDIVMDYVCKHLIKIDEERLEEDLSIMLSADPNSKMEYDSDIKNFIVSKNLQELSNYYEVLPPSNKKQK